jgi:hypothetical protein
MYRSKTIIVILICFSTHLAFSQSEMNSAEVESKSYSMYIHQKWSELIELGNRAIEQKQDYFYLRLRLGIAYFNTNQFRIATIHFQKALSFNTDDATAQEYLYWSLTNAGRFHESRLAAKKMGFEAQQSLNYKNWSGLNFISTELGTKISKSSLFNSATYFQLNLSHSVGNRFSLIHAVTSYNQTESRGTISQWQYFIQATFPLGKGWSVAPSFHYVDLAFKNTIGTFVYREYVLSANLTKSIPHFDFSLGGGYSTVEVRPQYIQQSTVAYYPKSNANFVIGTTLYIHSEDNSGIPNNSNFSSTMPVTLAVNPFISFQVSKRLSVFANYFKNKTDNIPEANGYLINNSQDLTVSRFAILPTVQLSSRWDLYGLFQWEDKQQVNLTTYQYTLLLIGLKFKPL